jgi:DNA-binding response OmpR family regulator/HPt (histidine-containing phosphotransfer) domain-containing protein
MASAPSSQPGRRDASTFGGARADFVAQLGRRVLELKQALLAVEVGPELQGPRSDLRRKLHALGSAARVLHFEALAAQLAEAERWMEETRGEESLPSVDLARLRVSFDELPSIAWGEAAIHSAAEPVSPPAIDSITWPASALVIGAASLADALVPEVSLPGDSMLECERISDPTRALDLARALAPDLVVLDADLPGALELARQLSDDPMTEPVPLVVVGHFTHSEQASRWIALGAARVLARPVSPRALQEACASVMHDARRAPRPEPLGQLNLDQLADRLAEELRRGLCDAASAQARGVSVAIGDGHDMMAALWSSIVRIRELTTLRSGGDVRFSSIGPEGAVAVGSWLSETRSSMSRTEQTQASERLEGRLALVVDDDPAVTWFLSGVLRAAGATVLEAHDGEKALALAYRRSPDLVISDILMPKVDGFSLCRALKQDVALRDVPVILLSWKEDLLQRVRELGVSADGYLRKEASARVVLQRVHEVLRPRTRVEKRLIGGGEVRGRLDGLTIPTLLRLIARHMPDARLELRDASFLYEIELRGGSPLSLSRTTPDGRFERGAGVLPCLLGVGAGRFVVTPCSDPLRSVLEGDLDQQLLPAIARARAAQRLLTGASLMAVRSVDILLEIIQPYFLASPLSSRQILDKLAEGISPRSLLMRGGYSARLLEDVLSDTAIHGGVARILGMDGEDLLPAAVEQDLVLLMRGQQSHLVPEEPAPAAIYASFTPSPMHQLPQSTEAGAGAVQVPSSASRGGASSVDGSMTSMPTVMPASQQESMPVSASEQPSAVMPLEPPPVPDARLVQAPLPPQAIESEFPRSGSSFWTGQSDAFSEAPSLASFSAWSAAPGALSSASGEPLAGESEPQAPGPDPAAMQALDSVNREPGSPIAGAVLASDLPAGEPLSAETEEPSPEPEEIHAPQPSSAGGGRVSLDAASRSSLAGEMGSSSAGVQASLIEGCAPTEVQPSPSPGSRISLVDESHISLVEEESPLGQRSLVLQEHFPVTEEASLARAPQDAPRLAGSRVSLLEIPEASRMLADAADVAPEASRQPEREGATLPGMEEEIRPSVAQPTQGAKVSREVRGASWGWVGVVLALVVSGSWWVTRDGSPAASQNAVAAITPESHAGGPAPSDGLPPPAMHSTDGVALSGLGVEDLPLAPGETLPDGQGEIEIVVGRKDEVFVDHLEVGKGPRMRVALVAGAHEVRTRRKGDEQPLMVTVKPGRRTRVDLRGPWRR